MRLRNCIYLFEFDGTLELCGRACGNQTASLLGTFAQCLGRAGNLPSVAGPPLPWPWTALFFVKCFVAGRGP